MSKQEVKLPSRLIRRDGVLPGGSPQRQGLWLRLEGLVFWVAEHGLCSIGDAGEEVVMVATNEGNTERGP